MKNLTMDEIWAMIKEGNDRIEYNDDREAILVIGIRGSGKTTTTLILTDEDNELESVESRQDAREFIIIDPRGHRIHHKANKHRSIYPKMMMEQKTVYYDCPSFSQSNDPSSDIISNHFMKKITNHLLRIKFLFTIEYSSVKRIAELKKFINWIRQVTRIMESIENFEKNIGLVVTKVDNRWKVSDAQIIREIKHFLEAAKVYVHENEYDWKFQKYTVKLIDILLFDDDKCNKLTILRRPNRLGPVHKLKHIRKEKLMIKNMMNQCVQCTTIKEGFAYTIQKNTEAYIVELVHGFHLKPAASLESIALKIRRHIHTKERQYHDIHALQNELERGWHEMSKFVTKLPYCTDFQDLGNQLEKSLETMNILGVEDDISIFFIQHEYLQFLEDVSSMALKIYPSEFKPSIGHIEKYFEIVQTFYRLIITTHTSLSSYKVQVKQDEVSRRVRKILKDKRIILKKFFRQFFAYLCSRFHRNCDHKEDISKIKRLPTNQWRMKTIHNLLSNAFNKDTKRLEKINGTIKLYGNYLKTSEVQWNKLDSQGIHSVKLFALQKVFLDSDVLFASPGFDVTIIAPIWEVVKKTTIFFRWFAFEPKVKFGFLGIGEIMNDMNLYIDGRSMWLDKDNRVMKDVNLIELKRKPLSNVKYGNVKHFEGSKTCQLKFETNTGVNFKAAAGYTNGIAPWQSSAFKIKNINEYKFYILENSYDRIGYRDRTKMYQELSGQTCVYHFYGAREFVSEMLYLETQFKWPLKDDFIPLYESLKKRIEDYKKDGFNRGHEVSMERDIAWQVYRTVSSKLWSLKHDFTNDLIIDVESRIDNVMAHINQLNAMKKVESVEKYANNFGEKIKHEAEGMLSHLEENILPAIDEAMGKIDERTDKLTDEVNAYIKEFEDHRKKMQEERDKAKLEAILGFFAKLLKGIGTLVSLLTGPVAPLVGGAIVAAVSIAENFIPHAEPPTMSAGLPTGARKMANKAEAWQKNQIDMKRKGLERALQVVNIGVQNVIFQKGDLKSVQSTLKNALSKGGNMDYEKATDKLHKENLRYGEKLDKKSKPTAVVFSTAELVTITLDMEINEAQLKDEFQNNDQYTQSIAEDTKKLEIMKMVRRQVEDNLKPALAQTRNFLNKASGAIDRKDRVKFNEQDFQIKKVIRDMQQQMRQVMSGFKTAADINDAWDQLKDVMEQLINIYKQIHDGKDKAEMVLAISSMHAAAIQPRGKWMNNADKELIKSLDMIDRLFLNNLIIGEYMRLLDALRLSTFPFVNFYLGLERTAINMNPNEDVTSLIERKMKSLKSSFVEYRTTIVAGYDDNLREAYFSSRNELKNPFYVWKNRYYKKIIKKLLSGKTVFLVADVLKGRPENAVKFSKIEFTLKSKDENIQKQIDDILEGYRISLIHLGVSRYKCDHKVYVIVSNPVTLDFSFSSKGIDSDRPRVQSSGTKKISMRPILSPYATWNISLIRDRPNAAPFDELQQFSTHVDLELGGRGSYVIENSKVCYDNLDLHYRVDRTTTQGPHYFKSENSGSSKRRPRRSVRSIPNQTPAEMNEISSWLSDLPRKSISLKAQRNIDNRYKFQRENDSFGNCSTTSLANNLLFFDCLVRKCTGLKINALHSQHRDTNIQNATIKSIQLTQKFEKSLGKLFENYYPNEETLSFDPCALISPVTSQLLQNKPKKQIGDVFFDHVQSNNSQIFNSKVNETFLHEFKALTEELNSSSNNSYYGYY